MSRTTAMAALLAFGLIGCAVFAERIPTPTREMTEAQLAHPPAPPKVDPTNGPRKDVHQPQGDARLADPQPRFGPLPD